MDTHGNKAFDSNTYTETEYMNGGVMVNLLKLMASNGLQLDEQQKAHIAAHDSMKPGTWYTDRDVERAKATTPNT